MIDENLCRAEPSAADRARYTARRKAIYLEKHPETKRGSAGAHGSNKAQGKGDAVAKLATASSFTEDTAKKTGESERVVRLHAERGEKIAAGGQPGSRSRSTASMWIMSSRSLSARVSVVRVVGTASGVI